MTFFDHYIIDPKPRFCNSFFARNKYLTDDIAGILPARRRRYARAAGRRAAGKRCAFHGVAWWRGNAWRAGVGDGAGIAFGTGRMRRRTSIQRHLARPASCALSPARHRGAGTRCGQGQGMTRVWRSELVGCAAELLSGNALSNVMHVARTFLGKSYRRGNVLLTEIWHDADTAFRTGRMRHRPSILKRFVHRHASCTHTPRRAIMKHETALRTGR